MIAVFGSNDVMSLGFILEAIHDGKHIPQDFAISGYDDLPFSKNYNPSLDQSSANTLLTVLFPTPTRTANLSVTILFQAF